MKSIDPTSKPLPAHAIASAKRTFLAFLLFLSSLCLAEPSRAQVINFENFGGLLGGDNTSVSDQFRTSHGVRFRLDTKGNGLPGTNLPRVEAAGQDGTDAFVGLLGNDQVGSESAARLGNFFLRSHLSRDAGATTPLSLIILYDTPVSAASGEIWDIDGLTGTEQWQIDAMGADYVNSNDVTDIVDSILSPLGNTSLLNGKPWTFSFNHHGNNDIHAIRIQFVGSKTSSIGFGFDNFSPSSPAPEVENCAPSLPPKRSTRYNNTNTNIVPFAHQPQFNATVATTIESWVYREGAASRVESIVAQDLDSGLCLGLFPNLRFYRSGGSSATIPVTVPANRWTHVAVSYDGTTARFYLDGVLAGERPLSNSGTGGTQRLFLGGEAEGLPFLGCLDEVRIWSLARTEGQIRNGMYQELRLAPGLAAAFPEGGMNEVISGLRGAPNTEPETRVWGMLPNNLVVPRVNSITFDGEPIVATEFAGAEEMPIRYAAGPDGHAWLVYTDKANNADDKLYVGLTNLRTPASGTNWSSSNLAVYLDRGRMRQNIAGAQDFRFQKSMDGVSPPSTSFIGNGAGSWRGISGANFTEALLANSYRIKSVIPGTGEFDSPVFEFQIDKALFGDFDTPAGFAISHTNAEHFFDIDMAPGFAHPTSPATWTCLTFGDAVDRQTTEFSVTVGIQDTITRAFLGDYQFSIYDAGTGELLAERRAWSGRYTLRLTLPANRPLLIQIPGCSYCGYAPPLINPLGIQPTSTRALEVVYPGGAANSSTTLAEVTFQLAIPLPPIEFTSILESEAPAPLAVRTSPDLKLVPEESTITLQGRHFHERLEVYLHDCLNIVPIEGVCREGIDYILCEVLSISPNRTSMVVKLPPARNGRWNVAIKDNWTRPGVLISSERWTVRGPLFLTSPDYPQTYGFEFINKADNREFDGEAWKHFGSVFQNSIYRPVAFCAPDPMYVLFFGVFGAVDRSINGTCVGFASTSRLFQAGNLDSNDYGAPYPFGLPGVPMIANDIEYFIPQQPDRYSWRGICRGYEPSNLWGLLRTNHMVQLSHESIEALFDQVDGTIRTGGDPREVFDRLRAVGPNYVLSMNRSGGGHSVTPIRVHMGYQVSSTVSHDSYSMTANTTPVSWDPAIPRYRAIEIYDNNYPGVSRYIGIDWERNLYFYDRGKRGEVDLPDYEGKALFTLPISIWRNSRTRPRIIRDGLEILYEIMAGDANVEHEDASGNKWGWGEKGVFQEEYPDAKTMFLMDGLEEQTKNALFFPPPGTVPAVTRIRGGGGEYCFHADQGSVMVQLHANSTPGGTQALNLATDPTNKLCGLQITPPVSLANVRACLGKEFTPNETATFDLSGIDLGGNQPLSIELVDGTRAIEVRNDGAQAITYDLKVNAADYSANIGGSRAFGQVTVPAKSVQMISLSDWPQNASLRAETDLDEDGVPDITTTIEALPAPQLHLSRSGPDIKVTWDHIPDTTLMRSSDLIDWTPVTGVEIEEGKASYGARIEAGSEANYFQLFELVE